MFQMSDIVKGKYMGGLYVVVCVGTTKHGAKRVGLQPARFYGESPTRFKWHRPERFTYVDSIRAMDRAMEDTEGGFIKSFLAAIARKYSESEPDRTRRPKTDAIGGKSKRRPPMAKQRRRG